MPKRKRAVREQWLATFASVLAILLLLQVGVEYYSAMETAEYIESVQKEQNDETWATFLSIARKVSRGEAVFPAFVPEGKREDLLALVKQEENLLPFAPLGFGNEDPRLAGIDEGILVAENGQIAWNLVSPYLPTMSPPLASTLLDSGEVGFPFFERTMYPVSEVPNWGAMHSPDQWDRHFKELTREDFVPLPRYNLRALTVPMDSLTSDFTEKNIPLITAKLTYSTRYYGTYDIDAGEYSGEHPGIDMKLAFGTPVGALAGGRVQLVAKDDNMGLYVMVEHRVPGGETYYSIYGHLDSAWVQEGEGVRPGQSIGTVGMTGNTTAPHLHLQVDRGDGSSPHLRFWPDRPMTNKEAEKYTMNPMDFIQEFEKGFSA